MNQVFRRLSVVAFFVALVVLLAVPTTSWAASEPVSQAEQVSDLAGEPITAFRMRMAVRVSGDAFDTLEFTGAGITGMTIEAAFTKVPPAVQMTFGVDENLGVTQDIQMIQIDGSTYINLDGEWIDSPTEEFGNINELFDTMGVGEQANTEGLEFIGNEVINGRPSRHYRGTEALLKDLDLVGVDQDFAQIFNDDMSLQMDIWIDDELGFETKVNVVMEGPGVNQALPDAVGRVEISVELYDFNGNIVITAPVNGQAAAPTPVLINEPTPAPAEPTPAPTLEPTPEPQPQATPEPVAAPDLAPQPASAPQAPAEVGPMTRTIWGKVKK